MLIVTGLFGIAGTCAVAGTMPASRSPTAATAAGSERRRQGVRFDVGELMELLLVVGRWEGKKDPVSGHWPLPA